MSFSITLDAPAPTPQQEALIAMVQFEQSLTFRAPVTLPPNSQMDTRRQRKVERMMSNLARLRVEHLLAAIAATGAIVERTDR